MKKKRIFALKILIKAETEGINLSIEMPLTDEKVSLKTIAWIFFKIGLTAFGGPLVSVSMMEDEVVEKHKWIEKEQFLDLIGTTNLIPGPNAVEMAIHIGYILRGWIGLLVSGCCFIFPALIISLGLAFLYINFGALPQLEPIFFGIYPVVLAIIIGATYRLGKLALKKWQYLVIVIVVIPLTFFFDKYIIFILLGSGIVGMLWIRLIEKIEVKHQPKEIKKNSKNGNYILENRIEEYNVEENNSLDLNSNKNQQKENLVTINRQQIENNQVRNKRFIFNIVLVAFTWGGLALLLWLLSKYYPNISLIKLTFFFYIIGSILYGSGYVLIAYIRGGLVEQYNWLTQKQLIDAIAIGQFTPGPLTSTVTVIGLITNGFAGAALATLGFYIPSFLIILLVNPVLKQLRKSSWAGAFLDAVNVSSIAVMLVLIYQLGESFFIQLDIWSILVVIFLLLVSLFILIKWKKINSAILVIGGAIIGGLLKWFVL
ncbi:MAG: chromate transporter [Candidatus Heimdallarchaeota archaeon]|nr:chromate transporter [Candidatus Heimdallarchaeota archaeon]